MNLEERIKEEEARFEELNQAFETLLKDADITRAQLHAFVNDASQFTEENWAEMRTLREELEGRLQSRLDKVPKSSPSRARSSLASIRPTWIPVR